MLGAGRHRRLDDSDSDSDTNRESTNVLTAARASELCPRPSRLIASGLSLAGIEDLSSLSSLDYVDISNNAIRSLEGLMGLKNLQTVIANRNRIASPEHILRLSTVRVLNMAENELVSTDWLLQANFAPNLNALILNSNKLTLLDGVSALSNLETLVVSRNQVEDLSVVGRLPHLKKLSVSHNIIRAIPDCISNCPSLIELRISHNRLATLPRPEVLCRLSILRILDVGHNRLAALDGLEVLAGSLEQLNIAGNPIDREITASKISVLDIFPGVQILNGLRMTGGRRKVRLARERRLRFSKNVRQLDASDDIDSAEHAAHTNVPKDNMNEGNLPREALKEEDAENAVDAEEFVRLARKNTAHAHMKSSLPSGANRMRAAKRRRRLEAASQFEDEGVGQWAI